MANGTLSIVGLTSESSITSTFSWPYVGSDPVVKVVSTGAEVWYYNPKSSSTVLYGSYPYTRPETFLGLSTSSGGSVNYNIGDEVAINTSGNSYSLYVVVEAAQNETYLTTGFDLTSIADAIRTKTWGTSDLTFPSQYISSISNLPTGSIQSSRSVTYNSPGSATILPDSGYAGFESASIEFSPNVWDGQYTWTPGGLTDLTGTTWFINESPNVGGTSSYNINFTSNSANYTSFDINNGIAYVDGRIVAIAYDPGMSIWFNQNFRTIEITSGTDVTNSNLIAWLQANATQIS